MISFHTHLSFGERHGVVEGLFQEVVRPRALVLLEGLGGHVVRLGDEAALGDVAGGRPARQPVGDVLVVDVVHQAAGILSVINYA